MCRSVGFKELVSEELKIQKLIRDTIYVPCVTTCSVRISDGHVSNG